MSEIITAFADRLLQKQRAQRTTDELWNEANEMRLNLIERAKGGVDIQMHEICACADAWRAFNAAFNKEGA